MSDMLHLHLRWKLSDNRPTVIRLPVLESWESKEDELRTTRGQAAPGKLEQIGPAQLSSAHEEQAADETIKPKRPGGNSDVPIISEDEAGDNIRSSEQVARLLGGRRKWKMRGQELYIAWFESTGSSTISEPPTLTSSAGIESFDLFIHRVPVTGAVQIWRWEPRDDALLWKPVALGKELKVPGLKRPRILVITEHGKPSYVTPGTVERKYNNVSTETSDSEDESSTTNKKGKGPAKLKTIKRK